jgi:hypothetical protein
VAVEPHHLYRLFALLDPLLRLATLILEVNLLPVRQLRIGHDEAQPREEFSGMMLNLGHDSPCRRSTGRLIEKSLVPGDRLNCRAVYRPSQ